VLVGKHQKKSGLKPNPHDIIEICNGFNLKNSVLMIKTEAPYQALLAKVREKGASYILETNEWVEPPKDHLRYESYLEGQERIIVDIWRLEGHQHSHLNVSSEIFDGKVSNQSESFYISNLEDPVGYYYDLSRTQRPYEHKLNWLLNIALSLPSVEDAIRQSSGLLTHLRAFAIELIIKSDNAASVESLMKKANSDEKFLLQLMRSKAS
jgi:hypothetical protein